MLETGLTLNGFRVTASAPGAKPWKPPRSGQFDAVLSDIYMPDGGGLELVDALRATDPNLPIVLMTAQGSLKSRWRRCTRGASDFIGKPFDISAVVDLLRRSWMRAAKPIAVRRPRAETQLTQAGLVGRSAPMIMVYKLIAQAARTEATVLIMGESGTGKELVARAIHDFSARRSAPVPQRQLLRPHRYAARGRTLRPHARRVHRRRPPSAPASSKRPMAARCFSTSWPPPAPRSRPSLLRVLQSGEVRRVGSPQSRRVNVRVIGASNAPLARPGGRGHLPHRPLLPPERARASNCRRCANATGDVELLTGHFLQTSREPGEPPLHLTREAADALNAHDFPGNVRELENALRRAVALSSRRRDHHRLPAAGNRCAPRAKAPRRSVRNSG